ELTLGDGRHIVYPIDTPGSLKLTIKDNDNKQYKLDQAIKTGKDLEIKTPGKLLINDASLEVGQYLRCDSEGFKNRSSIAAK
ncbi:MAG: hypothetical protein GWN00_39575, partial [Aliifodinibius sp.]|nr:hypothetical protein [Fodinibius sp.]NIV16667.1 hypothetical protein [Fodinibius sp.]NIY30661.1 hypothetical protein [Fodinibius sp.]